jgi:hypothetical protein
MKCGSGRKNGLVYQWAKKGTRPRQPKDQLTPTLMCSARSARPAIPAPRSCFRAPTPAPCKLHLDQISSCVAGGAHAVITLDNAG